MTEIETIARMEVAKNNLNAKTDELGDLILYAFCREYAGEYFETMNIWSFEGYFAAKVLKCFPSLLDQSRGGLVLDINSHAIANVRLHGCDFFLKFKDRAERFRRTIRCEDSRKVLIKTFSNCKMNIPSIDKCMVLFSDVDRVRALYDTYNFMDDGEDFWEF